MTADLDEVLAVARETLQDPSLSDSAALLDAKGYDSLTHVRFVLALQKRYGVMFGAYEIKETSTAAEVSQMIQQKRG